MSWRRAPSRSRSVESLAHYRSLFTVSVDRDRHTRHGTMDPLYVGESSPLRLNLHEGFLVSNSMILEFEHMKKKYRRRYRLLGCTRSDEIFSSVIEKMAVVCLLNLVCHSIRPSYLRFRVTPRLSASVSNIFLRFQTAGAVFIKGVTAISVIIRRDNFFLSQSL